jgi:prepilin-type N-terminal cleavage/methylation domain-containing protein
MKPQPRSPNAILRRAGGRGFTLMELLVAITAGLFVSLAAVALAHQGSVFFQQEARIATAQFGATLGFDRMRADIARAGFMSSPNIAVDPLRCGAVDATWPVGLRGLAAVWIDAAKTSLPVILEAAAAQTKNNMHPDRITLGGSYSSFEWFPVRGIFENGANYDVYLQVATGAITRSGGTAALGNVFTAGRMLRMLDSSGHYEYGVIKSFAIAAGDPVITLEQNPNIPMMRAGQPCGVKGNGTGMLVNVVNLIRYEIRQVSTTPGFYAPLYAPSAKAPGDESRLELVRVELDATGAEMGVEIVAEYAVDLKFGVSEVTSYGPSLVDPVLVPHPIGDATGYALTRNLVDAPSALPQRVRIVRARLAVRSREGDRKANIPGPAGGGIYRYAMPGGVSFARVRTMTADIALPNLAGVTW